MDDTTLVDLDAIAPRKGKIVLDGETIPVEPPTLEQYVIMVVKRNRYLKLLESQADDDQLKQAITDIKTVLYELIPQVKDKTLSILQVNSLLDLLTLLGAPSEDITKKELEKRGITLTGDKIPKDDSISDTK